MHYIAPDVYGDPALYCVQVPPYSVVDSKGGRGSAKHWGSPFGCQSVTRFIDIGMNVSGPYMGPLAAYTFGEPLVADEVIDREWCSRCSNTADTVRRNAAERGESEDDWFKEHAKRDLGGLVRDLRDYLDD